MQGETRYVPIRVGAMQAFGMGGTQMLEHPKRFVGVVLDFVDPDAPQTKTFVINCDGDFLSSYIGAARARSQAAIEEAARRAEYVLRNDRQLRDDTAQQIACELAFALANYLRTECPEWVRLAAVGLASSDSRQRRTTTPAVGGSGVAEPRRSSVLNGRVASQHLGSRVPDGDSLGNQVNTNTTTDMRGANTFRGTTSGGINIAALSGNPSVRKGEIEQTGVGMRWFDMLKAICALASAVRFFQIFYYMSLAAGASASTQNEFKAFMSFVTFGMGLLCIAYLYAYSRLRCFKKAATTDFCIVRIADLLTLGITYFVFSDMAAKYDAIYVEYQGFVIIYLITHLIISLSSMVYLENRNKFFTL